MKRVRPMFTNIVTTAEKFEEDYTDNGIIVAPKGNFKPWQRVVAVGSTVRDIKEGDLVMVNFDNYAVRRYDKNSIQNDLGNNGKIRYAFNFITMDDEEGNPTEYFLFTDRDVLFAFEGEERPDDSPSKGIIMPNAPLVGIS